MPLYAALLRVRNVKSRVGAKLASVMVDAQAVGGRPVEPPRQADRPGRARLGPRFDVALVLHPAERHVDRPALQRAFRPFHQRQTEGFCLAEQLQDEPLGAGERRYMSLVQGCI